MTVHALGKVRRQHQCEADRFPDERFEIETELVREAQRIIAECPQDRDDLLTLYGADPARIEVVPCGFDPQELAPMDRDQARRELGWDADEFTLLQLGRLVPRKGIANVLHALAVMRERHGLRARLRIVGGNSERPHALATPEIGRLARLAVNGVNGWLETDPRRLLPVMRTLLQDAALARRWGEAARRTAQQRFALARFVDDWLAALAAVGTVAAPARTQAGAHAS